MTSEIDRRVRIVRANVLVGPLHLAACMATASRLSQERPYAPAIMVIAVLFAISSAPAVQLRHAQIGGLALTTAPAPASVRTLQLHLLLRKPLSSSN